MLRLYPSFLMIIKSIFPLLALGVILSASTSHAQELTDTEREQLNKRLQKIINKSEKTLAGRQAAAYRAYKNGLSSNTAAFELYLNCIEKVNFTDQGKKNSDFRDWKRKNKDKHSDQGFRLALRHQLNWLVLTIDAARSENEDYSDFSSKALSAIDSILDDGKALEKHNNILQQSVLGSIYAKAYGFGNFKIKNWAEQPLAVSNIFEKIILPSLRKTKNSSSLRSAWLKRINYEETMIELWSAKPEGKSLGMKKAIASPALEVFTNEQRPNLIWQMELDVFRSGDEAGAASRMLNHISANHSHNNATKWAEELSKLLTPKKKNPQKKQVNSPKLDDNTLRAEEINNFEESEDE